MQRTDADAGLGPLIVVVSAVVTRHGYSTIGPFDVVCAVIPTTPLASADS
ncbi:MAG: hypothetical protein ACQEXM_05485 [Actinomycetota bacterium]